MVFRIAETFSARALSREMPSSDLGGGQLLAHSVHLQIANLSVKGSGPRAGGNDRAVQDDDTSLVVDGQSRSGPVGPDSEFMDLGHGPALRRHHLRGGNPFM